MGFAALNPSYALTAAGRGRSGTGIARPQVNPP
jgi:hypothetical protein